MIRARLASEGDAALHNSLNLLESAPERAWLNGSPHSARDSSRASELPGEIVNHPTAVSLRRPRSGQLRRFGGGAGELLTDTNQARLALWRVRCSFWSGDE